MVDRTTLQQLRKIVLPAILVSVWMLALSLVCGFLLFHVSDLPLETALLGSTAGGIAEMAMLGLTFHADTVTITILQLVRVVLFLVLMPSLARLLTHSPGKIEENTQGEKSLQNPKPHRTPAPWNKKLLLTSIAFFGGTLGKGIGIPAGDLLGSMFAVGAANVFYQGFPGVPHLLRVFARIGLGISMARDFTPETLVRFKSLAVPIIVLGVVMILSGVLLSWLLYRFTGWDIGTCLLASSPAGLTQMSVIADEVGANPLIVSVLHTARLLSIVIILPFIFNILIVSRSLVV
jgi:membrane AbrB-like protein